MKRASLLLSLVFAALAAAPAWSQNVVTIYAADGLHDGKGSWFETQFAALSPKPPGSRSNMSRAAPAASSSGWRRRSRTRKPMCLVHSAAIDPARRSHGPSATLQANSRGFDRRRRRVPISRWSIILQNFIYNSPENSRIRRRGSTTCSVPSSRARSNIRRPARPVTAPR